MNQQPAGTFGKAVGWLERLETSAGMDFRLERLFPVLDLLGNPERSFPSVHVVGTNGKGSTAAFLHSIYTEAGYKAGLYTSPHLLSFCERIRVGRGRAGEKEVVEALEQVRLAMDKAGSALTFFEIASVMAFLEFRRLGVDIAIVEAGLGGRLDATNVVSSVAVVLTSVGLDHCRYLGGSLAEIAAEKMGVLRSYGVLLVTGKLEAEALEVVAGKVRSTGAVWRRLGVEFGPWDGACPLAGAHQRDNAAVAAEAVKALTPRFPVPHGAVARGVAGARWPGRLEKLSSRPAVLVDAAHNPQAAAALVSSLETEKTLGPSVLVFGVMEDKDWREMLLRLLPVFDHTVLVPIDGARALAPVEMAAAFTSYATVLTVAVSAREGLVEACRRAGSSGMVVVTGSAFLVAELYRDGGGGADPFGHELKHRR